VNVYICGIDHEIQTYDGRREAALKKQFEELLRNLVSKHTVQMIGDETYEAKDAIAKRVAGSMGIRWVPVEMSLNAREELGIAHEQRHDRYECVTQDGTPIGFRAKRVLSDGIREEYMLWCALRNSGDAKSILILCGFLHVEELRKRFEKHGCQVITDSLCKYSWYSHPDC